MTEQCVASATDWLQWIECHPGLAAWVQAIGTITAVLIAVFLPLWLEHRAHRERSRVIRLETQAAFSRVQQALAAVRMAVEQPREWPPDDFAGPADPTWLRGLLIPIQDGLVREVERTDGLTPEFSNAIAVCLWEVREYNRLLEDATDSEFNTWPLMKNVLPVKRKAVSDAVRFAVTVGLGRSSRRNRP
jgi:hypothetical protein